MYLIDQIIIKKGTFNVLNDQIIQKIFFYLIKINLKKMRRFRLDLRLVLITGPHTP